MERESGVLLMKNINDRVEYHLYDKEKIVSIDINEMLNRYIGKIVHIEIRNDEVNVVAYGVLSKGIAFEGDKYYVGALDVEEILFATTDLFTNIVIDEVSSNETKIQKKTK